jgi:hypothetical protein
MLSTGKGSLNRPDIVRCITPPINRLDFVVPYKGDFAKSFGEEATRAPCSNECGPIRSKEVRHGDAWQNDSWQNDNIWARSLEHGAQIHPKIKSSAKSPLL